jgi:D-beta-D-heptose 7-phosphate kinase/D-beta-D-heptose 1-phosphate adenosyltransferase
MKYDLSAKLRLPTFSSGSLLVVGDVMLDRYWNGFTSRISPEAPVPVVQIKSDDVRVGGAGNVALNAASIGAKVRLIGLVGDDENASMIEGILSKGNVSFNMQRIANSKTITKLRVLAQNQQLLRLDFEDKFRSLDQELMINSFRLAIKDANLLILSDYDKGTLTNSQNLIEIARSLDKKVIVDPKGLNYEKYRNATVITPNLSEFEAIVGKCANDKEIELRGLDLCNSLNLEAVLVTRSEKGVSLIARDADPVHIPAVTQEVFDVTGAGDTVIAVLGAALASSIPLVEAVKVANLAAGIAVAKLGTSIVSHKELSILLKSYNS